MVGEEEGIEGVKDYVRHSEGDHLEDEEPHNDRRCVQTSLRGRIHDVFTEGVVHEPVPSRKQYEDRSENRPDYREAPEYLLLGFQRAVDLEVERDEVG